jgi:mannosyltransferase OCH1-like enzyme
MQIHQYIWKTWKTHEIPPKFKKFYLSWKIKNPEYQVKLYNDDECLQFVKENFNDRIVHAYEVLPLGVMKADFWRYLIVYKYGGYYCDLDSKCLVPLNSWLPKDAKFVVSKENSFYFVQWAFYSEPGHKIFDYVIDLICEKVLIEGINVDYQIGNNKKYDTFVHYYTGPLLWTEAILNYINEVLETKIQNIEELNEEHTALLKNMGIYVYDFKYFSKMNNHMAASLSRFIRKYTSWRTEIKKQKMPTSS